MKKLWMEDRLWRIWTVTPFDFITCDVRMAGMDGASFYQKLKEKKSPYLNKIIFITGDTTSNEIQEFLNSIENPLLKKPFELDDIKEVIQGLLTNPSYGSKGIVYQPVVNSNQQLSRRPNPYPFPYLFIHLNITKPLYL